MPRFDRSQQDALKDYLYRSDIHDARIETYGYDRARKILTINAANSVSEVRINFTFEDVQALRFVRGSWPGDCETILSLTAEEDDLLLQNDMQHCIGRPDDDLYLLFQMFSGDELHIAARKVFIEIESSK